MNVRKTAQIPPGLKCKTAAYMPLRWRRPHYRGLLHVARGLMSGIDQIRLLLKDERPLEHRAGGGLSLAAPALGLDRLLAQSGQ